MTNLYAGQKDIAPPTPRKVFWHIEKSHRQKLQGSKRAVFQLLALHCPLLFTGAKVQPSLCTKTGWRKGKNRSFRCRNRGKWEFSLKLIWRGKGRRWKYVSMGFFPDKACHLACSYPPAFYAFAIKITTINSCPFLTVELQVLYQESAYY